MGTVLVDAVIAQARTLLQDEVEAQYRWEDSDLLNGFNEAQTALVNLKPDANAATISMTPVAGAQQSKPQEAISIIRVLRNVDGPSISEADIAVMDLADPSWHLAATSDAARHWLRDTRDDSAFYIWPPTSADLLLVVAKQPTTITDPSTETIEVDDVYAPALAYYVAGHALAIDGDDEANMNLETSFFNKFTGLVTGKISAEIEYGT